MASVTWPLLVAAAPSSRSRKVVRPRDGTAAAMHAMTLARMGGLGGWDIGGAVRVEGVWASTQHRGKVRHDRRSRHPQAHPRLSVRPRRARAGALPCQRLQPVRAPLRGTVGAATLDRQRRRGRAALPLAPRWLGRARRLRRKRHVARQSAPVPQRQSIFPGLARDLQLSRFRGSMRSRNAVPWKLQEIRRRQVNSFVRLLRQLAIQIGGAVLLLAHPSLAGLNSGSGLSGSTHWNNAVRSRLYFTRTTGDDADPDERTLTRMKANYAGAGDVLRLRWQHGGFVALEEPTGIDRAALGAKADRVFKSMLTTTYAEGSWTSP